MKTLLAFFLFVSVASAADLSGNWTGAFEADGSDHEVPQLFMLKQESGKLTGSGGPDATEQYPLTKGTVAGDEVKFEVATSERVFDYDLKAKTKGLRGQLSIKTKGSNETRNATVWLDRVHLNDNLRFEGH